MGIYKIQANLPESIPTGDNSDMLEQDIFERRDVVESFVLKCLFYHF